MQWKLDKALSIGVPIVGVAPYGQKNISQAVYNHSIHNVRWSTESIVDAIRQYAR